MYSEQDIKNKITRLNKQIHIANKNADYTRAVRLKNKKEELLKKYNLPDMSAEVYNILNIFNL